MSLSDSKNETNTAGSLFHVKGFQLEILSLDGAIEYRVKKIRKRQHLGPQDGVVVLVVAFFLQFLADGYQQGWSFTRGRLALLAFALIVLWSRATAIHYESVFAIPAIGLQLETHRGLFIFGKQLTTRVSRTFIPVSAISDIFINEGLCGWNVRRYLAILPAEEPRLEVVFEALDPPFAFLKEVYHGLRETLFEEWDEDK